MNFIKRRYYWLLPIVLLVLFTGGLNGQVGTEELSFRKLIKAAEAAEKKTAFGRAAEFYGRAYRARPKKTELIYRAGELYGRVRDYRAAADAFALATPLADRYPLVGLYYGRALKQDGRYEEAERVLTQFADAYNGTDRAIVREIARNEIAGIELYRRELGARATAAVSRPGRGVNTGAQEFGPVALSADRLFFSSTSGGQSRLYESEFRGSRWSKAAVPPGFPIIAKGEFGTGSFRADGRTFYFTICSGVTVDDNRCEIFVGTQRQNGTWSQPRALNDRINTPGNNNAWPAVAIIDGREYLFFASDRPGGRGGMDLYYAVRDFDPAGTTPFGPVRELGRGINTVSDEITPYYDVGAGELYFASNGQAGYGGLDLFRVTGRPGGWSPVRNMGVPINSAADDYGLTIAPAGGKGYLTSNRTFPGYKTTTRQTDIFGLVFSAERPLLTARVYDSANGSELTDVEVSVEQVLPDGTRREIGRRLFPQTPYDFDLDFNQRYVVSLRRNGYHPQSYEVQTGAEAISAYGQPIFLERRPTPALPPGTTPRHLDSRTARSPVKEPLATELLPTGATPAPASAPDLYYRIQISAESGFDPMASKFRKVRNYGELVGEDIPGKSIVRVTVGPYYDKDSLKKALKQVRKTRFSDAFPVEYRNGQRTGPVRLTGA